MHVLFVAAALWLLSRQLSWMNHFCEELVREFEQVDSEYKYAQESYVSENRTLPDHDEQMDVDLPCVCERDDSSDSDNSEALYTLAPEEDGAEDQYIEEFQDVTAALHHASFSLSAPICNRYVPLAKATECIERAYSRHSCPVICV